MKKNPENILINRIKGNAIYKYVSKPNGDVKKLSFLHNNNYRNVPVWSDSLESVSISSYGIELESAFDMIEETHEPRIASIFEWKGWTATKIEKIYSRRPQI